MGSNCQPGLTYTLSQQKGTRSGSRRETFDLNFNCTFWTSGCTLVILQCFWDTRLDGADAVLNLSVPCRGLLQALMLGRVNRQMAVYHPASNGCLQVPDSRELSRIAAACACAERKVLPDALACVDASLPQLPQDVYVAVLGLIETIMSVRLLTT